MHDDAGGGNWVNNMNDANVSTPLSNARPQLLIGEANTMANKVSSSQNLNGDSGCKMDQRLHRATSLSLLVSCVSWGETDSNFILRGFIGLFCLSPVNRGGGNSGRAPGGLPGNPGDRLFFAACRPRPRCRSSCCRRLFGGSVATLAALT